MNTKAHSPIVAAIHAVEAETTAEVRVHLSRRLNAVLLYVNLRRKKFAVVGDDAAHRALGQRYWEDIARDLKHQLISTHPEKAIALWVRKLGHRLAMEFPRQ
jgi:uncharacterized membrane protein